MSVQATGCGMAECDEPDLTDDEKAILIQRIEQIVQSGYLEIRMTLDRGNPRAAYWITDTIHHFPCTLLQARYGGGSREDSWRVLRKCADRYDFHLKSQFRDIPDDIDPRAFDYRDPREARFFGEKRIS